MVKTTRYIQVGDSRLPLDYFEIVDTTSTEAHIGMYTLWNEELRALHSPIHVEGTYEPTDFTRELFQAIDTASSITWHVLRPWPKHSRQTRAWYRVRARAQHRRKFVVHSHQRKRHIDE